MATTPFECVIRLAELPSDESHSFHAEPGKMENEAIATMLGVSRLRKLRLAGQIRQLDDGDWSLEAELGATVTQDCVVTLEPVVTRLDEQVARKYVANAPDPSGFDEAEADLDDSIEPIPDELDIGAVLIEELALALPHYPRVEGVAPFQACYAPANVVPLDDAAMKPFAGLAELKIPGPKTND